LHIVPLRYRSHQDPSWKEPTVDWIAISVAVVVLGSLIAFLFGPTIKTFFGPDFEPSPKDAASVDNALMNRMPDAGQ
jgi:hypothetical protein